MIGQVALRNRIDNLINTHKFPVFSIIAGPKDSGKRTLCKYISEKLNADIFYFENKIDDIHNFIEIANNQNRKVIYVLQDIDTASNNVKNALLKIIEEPVKHSIIILLCNNKDQLLSTIRSRGVLFELSPYSQHELIQWVNESKTEIVDLNNCLKVCSYIGELKNAASVNVSELLEYAEKIINNINKSTLSNSLKISHKLKLTEADEGYDLKLFLNCLSYKLVELGKAITDPNVFNKYISFINLIQEVQNALNLKAVNKKYLLDEFIIKAYIIFMRR